MQIIDSTVARIQRNKIRRDHDKALKEIEERNNPVVEKESTVERFTDGVKSITKVGVACVRVGTSTITAPVEELKAKRDAKVQAKELLETQIFGYDVREAYKVR